MAFIVDEETGHITLVQGDSGLLIVKGIDTNKNYQVYLSFYNSDRRILGEIMVQSNYEDTVTFNIPPNLTNLLNVEISEDTAEYYYGLKKCFKDSQAEFALEDTLIIGNGQLGELNAVTVYPKKVEGVINE